MPFGRCIADCTRLLAWQNARLGIEDAQVDAFRAQAIAAKDAAAVPVKLPTVADHEAALAAAQATAARVKVGAQIASIAEFVELWNRLVPDLRRLAELKAHGATTPFSGVAPRLFYALDPALERTAINDVDLMNAVALRGGPGSKVERAGQDLQSQASSSFLPQDVPGCHRRAFLLQLAALDPEVRFSDVDLNVAVAKRRGQLGEASVPKLRRLVETFNPNKGQPFVIRQIDQQHRAEFIARVAALTIEKEETPAEQSASAA